LGGTVALRSSDFQAWNCPGERRGGITRARTCNLVRLAVNGLAHDPSGSYPPSTLRHLRAMGAVAPHG
jgi:hypothetical protein